MLHSFHFKFNSAHGKLLTTNPCDSDQGFLFIASEYLTHEQNKPEMPELVILSSDERVFGRLMSQLAQPLVNPEVYVTQPMS